MRQLLKRLLITAAIFCSILSGVVVAGTCAAPGATTIFFVNGVWNFTQSEALKSLYALESLTSSVNGVSPYDFKLAYNPSDGYVSDVVESLGQSYGTDVDWAMFWLWLNNEGVSKAYDSLYLPFGLDAIKRFALPNSLPPQRTADVLRAHVAEYRNILKSGQKVIAVAHSQGNYFANATVENPTDGLTFSEQQSFTIVSVANPDDHIATLARSATGPVTLTEDLVIQAVSTARTLGLLRPSMTATYSNAPGQNGEIAKHAFVGTYLQTAYRPSDPRISLTAILNNIDYAVNATPIPPCSASSPIVIQPGPGVGKDIWTTSVFSYTPAGGGPGGGLNDDVLRVGGWGDLYYSLIQFDLSGPNLPKQAKSVVLRLYNQPYPGNGPTPMTIHRITQFWDWRTQGTGADRLRLWWADQPPAVQLGATAQRAAILPVPSVNAVYDIDITDLYNFWQSNPTQNFGLELQPTLNNNNWNLFLSSDYLIDPSLRPKLIITPP